MKRFFLPIVLFLMLVIEGVAINLLPSKLFLSDIYIIPHWVFVTLLLSAIFFDRERTYYSVLYAAIFGLLADIVYTEVLGVYMFSYAVAIYIMHEIKNKLHENFYVTIVLGIVGIGLVDTIIQTIFTFIGMADLTWGSYFIERMLPTILANLIFLIVLYPLVARRFKEWQKSSLAKDTSF